MRGVPRGGRGRYQANARLQPRKEMGVFSNFNLAFDAAQRKRWWHYYGEVGVPFTVLLLLAAVLLYTVRWRATRVFG